MAGGKVYFKTSKLAILLNGTNKKQAPKDSWSNRKMCLLGTEANENLKQNKTLFSRLRPNGKMLVKSKVPKRMFLQIYSRLFNKCSFLGYRGFSSSHFPHFQIATFTELSKSSIFISSADSHLRARTSVTGLIIPLSRRQGRRAAMVLWPAAPLAGSHIFTQTSHTKSMEISETDLSPNTSYFPHP